MKYTEVFQAWGRILGGRLPTLSIEITRECPLRCPGCYAYEDGHLGGQVTLRQLVDHKGEELVEGVMTLVQRYRPLHLSIVGGDPLVRHRELELLLPKLNQRGVFVQVVTSAFRPIPASWAALSRLNLVVSIDGLPPEHDARRKPATCALSRNYSCVAPAVAGRATFRNCQGTSRRGSGPRLNHSCRTPFAGICRHPNATKTCACADGSVCLK